MVLSSYLVFYFFSVVSPIIQLFGPNKPIKEGDSAKLICKIVKGVPEPQVSWFKNGNPLPKEMNTTLLSITNVTNEDEGRYTCKAENSGGFTNDSKYVTVESKLYKLQLTFISQLISNF